MSTVDLTEGRPLHEVAGGLRIAMVAIDGPAGIEARPLTVAHLDHERIWFLVPAHAPWLPPLGTVVNASFATDDRWISATGRAYVSTDADTLEDLRGPVSDAWFPEGEDPAALRIDVDHGHWWQSPGFVRTALSVARAKVTGTAPDAGSSGVLI